MKPYYQDAHVTLYCGRCEDVLPTLDTNSIDLVATDPPYYRVKGEAWDRQWDTPAGFLAWVDGLCAEWQRVIKPNGSVYVFASPRMAARVEVTIGEWFNVLNRIRWVKEMGWHRKTDVAALRSYLSPWEEIIFCEPVGPGRRSALSLRLRAVREIAGLRSTDVDIALGYVRTRNAARGTELCRRWEEGSSVPSQEDYIRALVACGDTREREDIATEYLWFTRRFDVSHGGPSSDVWNFPTVAAYPGKHPCEKPLAMMEHIVRTSSRPGALVLDCFAGSGSTLVAAAQEGRKAIGIEMDERWCNVAATRLQQRQLPLMETA